MNKKRGVVLVLLALFLLVVSFGKAQVNGCYYYPQSSLYCLEVSDEEAAADYTGYASYFSPGVSCDEVTLCEEITCSVDCQITTRGECEKLAEDKGRGVSVGWEEVVDDNYDEWCSPGCCRVGAFCQQVERKWDCERSAAALGLQIEVFDTSITSGTTCNQQVCGIEVLPATWKGFVLNAETGAGISGVRLEIEGTTVTTGTNGEYSFELSPGTKTIKISANGFLGKTESRTLESNETLNVNYTLVAAEGIANLWGMVKDEQGRAITDANVAWTGPTKGSVVGDSAGVYNITGLVLNQEYTITVNKYGFTTAEEKITLDELLTRRDFNLSGAELQGIKGNVWIDEDGDRTGDERVYGASIYVDGVFRSYSRFTPIGYYEVALNPGAHEVYATYLDFELADKFKFTIGEGETINKDLVLTKYVGECSVDGENPQKAVEVFAAQHVLGKKEVLLNWSKPCTEVSGYKISKYQGDTLLKEWTASPAVFSYRDEEVEWGETYTYKIQAAYTDVQLRESEVTETSITLGDRNCEGKYSRQTGWALFCLVEADKRKSVWTCDGTNQLVTSNNCGTLDEPGHVYFCAEVGETEAICKDTGGCNWFTQGADPFGLYYDRESCYGSNPKEEDPVNYCYLDYTQTIVDQCKSCTEISSCFEYLSKDACEINNCLGTECSWVDGGEQTIIDYSAVFPGMVWPDLVQPETGHGYCTEIGYEEDDKCGLCGPEADLYENYYCTAEVCSDLGRCFSAEQLSKCETCGEKPNAERNCYAYATELECVGGVLGEGQAITNLFGEIILSEDKCGWGRCAWQGVPGGAGRCVKDGDGNGMEDCMGLAFGEFGCRIDNQAPVTNLVPEGVQVISFASPTLTFRGEDQENVMGMLGYCLGSADPSVAKCTKFVKVDYPGRLKAEELVVNLVNGSLKGETIRGETYRLRYYSKDTYSNQENVREAFVFVDTEPPQFTISEDIQTVGDQTDLTIYLNGLNEPMSCQFEMKQILPAGQSIVLSSGREAKTKEVVFENLKTILGDLTVTCTDDYGNVRTEEKEYTFDLEQGINIVYPKGPVGSTSIVFDVETLVGASCELFTAKGEKVADFVTDEEGKKHQTSAISGFSDGRYFQTHKVVCVELLNTSNVMEEYFDFTVDLLFGSETEIVMREGSREEKRLGDGWEESFVESVAVGFNCPPSGVTEDGFACEQTYYCLTGNEFEPASAQCYQEFTGEFVLNDSINICYYSTDAGGNRANPDCGKILVDGYGITLSNPEEYYYNGEKWGVSNQPVFDWKIFTKVPTKECKFDFFETFPYETTSKIFNPKADLYVLNSFPTSVAGANNYSDKGGVKSVYVKCKDVEDKIGPAQKMNLEYDPTAPEITRAEADPDRILEGNVAIIRIETDDPTICKFDEGLKEFETMKWPLEAKKILRTEHEYNFTFGGFDGNSKTFNMSAQCRNGAGDESEIGTFDFFVDWTAAGGIVGAEVCTVDTCYPAGETGAYIGSRDVTLMVTTNKNAQCSYVGGLFETTGGTVHTQAFAGLDEKEHLVLVNCQIGEEQRSRQIKFTIDLTAPVISEVDDQKYSCSLEETPGVFVKTNEEMMSGYIYELYDRGNASTGTGTLISNGSVDATIPFTVQAELVENHTYYFKVAGGDAAGNWGSFKESDGFKAVDDDFDLCKNDTTAPGVNVFVNQTCTKTIAEIQCVDELGCRDLRYGRSFISSLCNSTGSYLGQQILFEESGWLCYKAEDVNGNNGTGNKKIEFNDIDGDGIADSCDKCPSTDPGKIADEKGCAYGELTDEEKNKDSDADGLPDYWEQRYDAFGCELDFANDDSNFDGIFDTDEDYDNDNYTNYEEFKIGFDPCAADAPPSVVVECTTDLDCVGELVCKEGSCLPVVAFPEFEEPAKPNIIAWAFLLLGLLLVLGGSGYLIYAYKVKVPTRPAVPSRPETRASAVRTAPKTGWMERLTRLRKERSVRERERKREEVFSQFSKESKEIPHVEALLQKKAPLLSKLDELARQHREVKGLVKPGLRHGEKSVFAKLDKIAEQTKEKKIEEVVSPGEAKNIFDRLKEISKKRKEEK